MEFVERVLRVAICSFLIYSCFEGKAQIGAQRAALSDITNNGDGEEISIALLNDEFRKVSKSEHRKVTKRDVESREPVDDEDANKENPGSGDEAVEMEMQSDEQSSPPEGNDQSSSAQNSTKPPESEKKLIATSTRALNQSILAKVSTSSPSKVQTDISPTGKYDRNSSKTVAINPQYNTPSIMGASIDAVVTTWVVKGSIHLTSIVSSKIHATETSSELFSRSSTINPTELPTDRPKTEETIPKGGSDVETQKDPKESDRGKTLFGFVTIEILVALLAGAACAVILLIFLVYRLKKRNEGSYELQESMSLKTAAYAEEKEVFV